MPDTVVPGVAPGRGHRMNRHGSGGADGRHVLDFGRRFMFEPSGGTRSRAFRRILEWMTKSAAVRRPLPTSPFKAPVVAPLKRFAVGDRVTHDTFGLGRVTGVEGDGDIAVLVDFGSRQERIIQPYTAMFKL